MGVLAAEEIKERLKYSISNPKSLVVTPLLDFDNAFSSDSVDLRLGTHFLLPQAPPRAFMTLDPDSIKSAHLRVQVPFGRYLVIPAHQTVLGATLEFIKLPADVSGQILTKSSIARTFVIIETAPWIHPSYRGCLTLEIANVSNTPLLLHPGIPIGQLVLQTVDLKSAPEHDILSGSYLGPVYPEAPKFKRLSDVLGQIGITKIEMPNY
jgi:dCTP deaminase